MSIKDSPVRSFPEFEIQPQFVFFSERAEVSNNV
jgi:hypothetical protein